jgi:Tol biopolymer transport system component
VAVQVDCSAQALVCQAGACVPADPCDPNPCTSPPANACEANDVLRAYPSTGTCTTQGTTASCDYAPTLVDCTAFGQTCDGSAGACAFPAGSCTVLNAEAAAWVLYADNRSGGYDIRAVRLDGSCDQPLGGAAGDDLGPAWSTAAGVVAWSGVRSGSTRVVTLDLAAAAGEVVLDTGPDASASPAFSPDGLTLAFERRALGGTGDVVSMPLAGGTLTTIAASPVSTEAGPVWAPDGLSVYIVADLSAPAQFEVWRVPLSGTGPERVTTGSGIQGRPDVSPDGTQLVYARDTGAGLRIVLHDLASGLETLLPGTSDSEPAFHSSGGLIAVRSQRFSVSDVVLLDAATGAVVRRLTTGGSLVGTPAFAR